MSDTSLLDTVKVHFSFNSEAMDFQEGTFNPYLATPMSAAFDLRSMEDCFLKPGEVKAVSTGLILEIPDGWEGQLRPRSGLALNHMVTVLNSPGTIDADYRGEIKVIVVNFGDKTFNITKKMRIAQIAIRKVPKVIFEYCDQLSETTRGSGGFGSTGHE